MKFKFAVVFSIIIICLTGTSAQDRNAEIEVSMDETSISTRSTTTIVNVKITNKADEVLKTEGLGNINFYFSRVFTEKTIRSLGDVFEAKTNIPAKILRNNETFEFKVNLYDLYWFDSMSGFIDPKKPNLNEVPSENIYFSANIKLLDKYEYNSSAKRKLPVYKYFRSNTIDVNFKR
jgi:hypothetical protein